MVLSSRQKELLLWVFGVFATVGLLLMIALPLERAEERGPASVTPPQPPGKEAVLKGSPDAHLQGKGSGSLKIDIRNFGKGPITAGSSAELSATVEALADLSGLEYNWLLPEGITAEAGATKGSIGRLAQGEKTTLNLSITSSVTENRQVHLNVYRKVGGESLGEIAQFNTVLQEKIDGEIEKRAEILKAQANPGKDFEDGEPHLPQGLVR